MRHSTDHYAPLQPLLSQPTLHKHEHEDSEWNPLHLYHNSPSLIHSPILPPTAYVFDKGRLSRTIAHFGIWVSALFGVACFVGGGVGILYTLEAHPVALRVQLPSGFTPYIELIGLLLNLIVTLCTESIGHVHATALRFQLASESRLEFSTNLRLITAAHGRGNPNNTLFNMVMAVLLIWSYTMGNLCFGLYNYGEDKRVLLNLVGVVILGGVLLIQAIIAAAGAHCAKISTWSSVPFDLTMALLHDQKLVRFPGRCMENVVHSKGNFHGPRMPLETQPSAHDAYPSVQRTIIVLWSVWGIFTIWGIITLVVSFVQFGGPVDSEPMSFAFFPNSRTPFVPTSSPAGLVGWLVVLAAMIFLQGALTMGVHCAEGIINVSRDEAVWRKATSKNGLSTSFTPLSWISASWASISLFIAKPVLRECFTNWVFGFAMNAKYLSLTMYPLQIFYLVLVFGIFALATTLVAKRRPRGPQPATYGHLQTLANVVDEWSPNMWWGNKEDGTPISHAGTSASPLPPVKMNSLYAGRSVSRGSALRMLQM